MREEFLTLLADISKKGGNIFFHSIRLKQRKGALVLGLKLYFWDVSDTAPPNPKPHSQWVAECNDIDKINIENIVTSSLLLLNNHLLLRWINKKHRNLLFYNVPRDYLALLGSLYTVHQNITKGTIPFLTHFNCQNLEGLRRLVMGGHGVLAMGPKELMQHYAEEIRKHGCEARIHDASGCVVA